MAIVVAPAILMNLSSSKKEGVDADFFFEAFGAFFFFGVGSFGAPEFFKVFLGAGVGCFFFFAMGMPIYKGRMVGEWMV